MSKWLAHHFLIHPSFKALFETQRIHQPWIMVFHWVWQSLTCHSILMPWCIKKARFSLKRLFANAKRILGRRRKESSLQLLPPAQQGWQFLDTAQVIDRKSLHKFSSQRRISPAHRLVVRCAAILPKHLSFVSGPNTCSTISFVLDSSLRILCYARCAALVGHPAAPPRLRQNHLQDLPPEPVPEARSTGGCWAGASEDPKSSYCKCLNQCKSLKDIWTSRWWAQPVEFCNANQEDQ